MALLDPEATDWQTTFKALGRANDSPLFVGRAFKAQFGEGLQMRRLSALLAVAVVAMSSVPASSGDCQSCNKGVVYTVSVDEKGDIKIGPKGLELMKASEDAVRESNITSAPKMLVSSAGRIEETQECETDQSSPDGRRTSCRSDGFTFVCPRGYYLVRKPNKEDHLHRISERGSENHIWLDWHNEVEIYPGTGVTVPTKVTFQVGARSNRGSNGSAGKTKVKFVCEVRKLPEA